MDEIRKKFDNSFAKSWTFGKAELNLLLFL